MKRMLVMTLAAVAAAQGVDDLVAAARAKEAQGKEGWAAFVKNRDGVPDVDLERLAALYDEAIELYQKAEKKGAETWTAVLNLARRTAQLRGALFWRDQHRRAKKSGERKPGPAAEEEPVAKPVEQEAPPEKTPAPRILETDMQRVYSIRAARSFVMAHFRHRKKAHLAPDCRRCHGDGRIQPRAPYDPKTRTYGPRPPAYACPTCDGVGQLLRMQHVRAALWENRTPHARAKPEVASEWRATEEAWTADPSRAPWLTRLRIDRVSYQGLWADVTWTEWRGKDRRSVTERLIRVGRRWYWFTEGADDGLLQERIQ